MFSIKHHNCEMKFTKVKSKTGNYVQVDYLEVIPGSTNERVGNVRQVGERVFKN